jgi:hypothetical protein
MCRPTNETSDDPPNYISILQSRSQEPRKPTPTPPNQAPDQPSSATLTPKTRHLMSAGPSALMSFMPESPDDTVSIEVTGPNGALISVPVFCSSPTISGAHVVRFVPGEVRILAAWSGELELPAHPHSFSNRQAVVEVVVATECTHCCTAQGRSRPSRRFPRRS